MGSIAPRGVSLLKFCATPIADSPLHDEIGWPTGCAGSRDSALRAHESNAASSGHAGIAGHAQADESDPASGAALIREWKSLEALCRGSNDPAACERLNTIADQLGQKGWCFNGYGSGRRWMKC
jgi:hypothetical protein